MEKTEVWDDNHCEGNKKINTHPVLTITSEKCFRALMVSQEPPVQYIHTVRGKRQLVTNYNILGYLFCLQFLKG